MVFIENKAALLYVPICGALFKSNFAWEQGKSVANLQLVIRMKLFFSLNLSFNLS